MQMQRVNWRSLIPCLNENDLSSHQKVITANFTSLFKLLLYFFFLWDHWAHCCIFENGVLLMYTLEDVSSVANFITAYEESQ